MIEDITKVTPYSMDIENEELEKLKGVFPQCFSEGSLDIDKLLSLCGKYIDKDFEKYKFEWSGKSECYRIAGKRSTGTLRPCPEESVDFENTKNMYIEGDNLEVLKLLQSSYYNKVKMIYIDPPYNTGNDFVYEDDFKDPMERYKEITSQTTKSNPETMGRFHTNWLNMMYPRLRLAANLLRDDGVIFISIDDNEVTNLRRLCDEVFGEENFVSQMIWQRAFAPKNDSKYTSNDHDYVIAYAKNLNNFVIGRLPRTEEANARYKNYDNDPRGLWISDNLTVKTYSEKYDYPITTPSGKVITPSHGSCWRVSKERFAELVADNRIWFGETGENVPRLKRFLSEVQDGMVASSLMLHKDVGHSQEGRQELKKLFDDKGYFDGPKPLRLLHRLLTLANVQNNDLILDFFSGSATTAHAVMQLNAEDGGNRQFIMVQLPELCDEKSEAYKAGYKNICEIGKERIRRAGSKIGRGDTGFKVFKLDTSNLAKWDSSVPTSAEGLFQQRLSEIESSIKFDRTDLDLVYEVMLKLGIPLDYKVIPIEINDKKAYSIGEDCLVLVCLDYGKDGITPDDVKAMCEYVPAQIVSTEKAFKDDSTLKNVYYILKNNNIEIKLL
ncbi:site-specific DNA-methyltransferase [Candidatus Gastranaerophilales bacterium]|nr:MAG: site-specific DNA-methyltransferase [Candidatus Gastranaerophilales bacterium]